MVSTGGLHDDGAWSDVSTGFRGGEHLEGGSRFNGATDVDALVLDQYLGGILFGKMIEADHGRAAHGFKDVVVDHAVVFRDSGQGQASAALRRPSSIVPSQQGLPCESAPVCSRGVSGGGGTISRAPCTRKSREGRRACAFGLCSLRKGNRKIAPKACECGYAEMKGIRMPAFGGSTRRRRVRISPRAIRIDRGYPRSSILCCCESRLRGRARRACCPYRCPKAR